MLEKLIKLSFFVITDHIQQLGSSGQRFRVQGKTADPLTQTQS